MHKPLFATIAFLLATLPTGAQTNREKIELLVVEENTAIFSAEGYAATKKDAVENATKAVLQRLLYDGVQDFNGGNPIVVSGQGTNLWLNEFFDGKIPTYKNFVGDVELVGDFDNTPSGEVHCNTNVIIKHTLLMQRAAAQGVTGEPRQSQPDADSQTKKPAKKSFL
jgi:hypothetical protein